MMGNFARPQSPISSASRRSAMPSGPRSAAALASTGSRPVLSRVTSPRWNASSSRASCRRYFCVWIQLLLGPNPALPESPGALLRVRLNMVDMTSLMNVSVAIDMNCAASAVCPDARPAS